MKGSVNFLAHHKDIEIRMCQFVALLYTILTLFSSVGFAKEPEKTYALLVRGSNEERFRNDEKLASQVLIEKGVPESQITVIGTGSSLEAIETAISDIGKKISQDGQFFIYLNSHGSRDGFLGLSGDDSYMVFDQSDTTLSFPTPISGRLLDRWVSHSISSTVEIILVVQACKSGNFTSTFLKPNRMVMTSAANNNSSYGCYIEGKQWSRFSYQFFSALKGQNPQGENIQADIDQNGIVSYKEAYLWAKDNGPLIPPTTFEELIFGYTDTPQFSASDTSIEEALLGHE